jgi:hypothetical protein
MELTNETARIYIAALVTIEPDLLHKAVTRGVQEWRFFPRLSEIFDEVRECQSNPVAHERAYKKLVERYVAVAPPWYTSRSLLDEAPSGLMRVELFRSVRNDLTRERSIGLGIEQPRAIDMDARLRELRRQAEELARKEAENHGAVREVGGLCAGLL